MSGSFGLAKHELGHLARAFTSAQEKADNQTSRLFLSPLKSDRGAKPYSPADAPGTGLGGSGPPYCDQLRPDKDRSGGGGGEDGRQNATKLATPMDPKARLQSA
jgi:hypothetical protein